MLRCGLPETGHCQSTQPPHWLRLGDILLTLLRPIAIPIAPEVAATGGESSKNKEGTKTCSQGVGGVQKDLESWGLGAGGWGQRAGGRGQRAEGLFPPTKAVPSCVVVIGELAFLEESLRVWCLGFVLMGQISRS